jgi:hypothetical protein
VRSQPGWVQVVLPQAAEPARRTEGGGYGVGVGDGAASGAVDIVLVFEIRRREVGGWDRPARRGGERVRGWVWVGARWWIEVGGNRRVVRVVRLGRGCRAPVGGHFFAVAFFVKGREQALDHRDFQQGRQICSRSGGD